MNGNVNIHSHDQSLLPKAQEASYLGNNLNYNVNIRHEVARRLDVKRTWLKLHVYWRDNAANKKWKILIYDAVVRSTLLYGLETLHLPKSLCRKLNGFHHRGLRKILGMSSTFV